MQGVNRINQCTMILTRACNLRCKFCYAQQAGYDNNERMSLPDAEKIVDFCREAKVKYIVFTGGEPLFYPDLHALLVYIHEQAPDIQTAIPTNGVLLSNAALCKKLLREGVQYFDISLKGTDPLSWQACTGADGYASQMQAIQNLANSPVEFTVSMVITEENVDNFCDAIRAAKNNGAKQFSFTFVIDNQEAVQKNTAYLKEHNPIMLIHKFIVQMDKLNRITDDWWIEYSFPLCFYTEAQLRCLKGRLASPCQIHTRDAVTFDMKMNLLPCDMYIGQSIGTLGRDFTNFAEFVQYADRPEYNRKIDELNNLPSAECQNCQYLQACLGGCPVIWKNYSFADVQACQENWQNN